MLTLNDIISAAKTAAAEYPITKIDLFGSYADGCATSESDIDILVEFETDSVSLITLSSFKIRMEELLNVSVDVIHSPIPEDSFIEINKVVPLYAA